MCRGDRPSLRHAADLVSALRARPKLRCSSSVRKDRSRSSEVVVCHERTRVPAARLSLQNRRIDVKLRSSAGRAWP